MYVEERLTIERHQERLRQAQQERDARQVAERHKLERRQQRAERELLQAWQRVERLRSMLGAVS